MPTKRPSPKKGKPQPRYDWTAIRIAREVGGKSFEDLSKRFGPHYSTISARARKEGWRDPTEVREESARAAAGDIARRFVAQESEAVFENRLRAHQITGRILGRVERRLDDLEKKRGRYLDPTDEALELRRLVLIAHTAEQIDSRVAGIKESEGWRPDRETAVVEILYDEQGEASLARHMERLGLGPGPSDPASEE